MDAPCGVVRRVRQQFRERGTLPPQTHRCERKTLLTEERKQRLPELLAAPPDATLAELGSRLERAFRTSTIDLWLQRLGWRLKKTLATAARNRPDGAAPWVAKDCWRASRTGTIRPARSSPAFKPIEQVWSKIKQITLRAPKTNFGGQPRPPLTSFPSPIAKASFFSARYAT
jgi:transposase